MNNTSIRDVARNLRAKSVSLSVKKIDPATGDLKTVIITHQVRVTVDEIILEDLQGSSLRAAKVDLTIDLTVSGVNGLDSGAPCPSTWYHIWIISTPSHVVNGLLSTSAVQPTLPHGYSSMAYVGALYNCADGNFPTYRQIGGLAWATKTCPLGMTAFPTNPTSINLSASVPSTASAVLAELSGLTTIGGHFISSVCVGPTPLGPWHNQWMMVAGTAQGGGSVDHVQSTAQCEIMLDTAQTIYAYVATANDQLELSVLGWRY